MRALLIVLAAGPALADETLVFRPELIDSCLANGGGRACIGVSVEPCSAETEGGYTTMGWAQCVDAELHWWEARMAATLDARRAYADAIDAEGTPEGWAERPSDRVALEKVQQAWQAFRDTACTYEAQQYWGGTGMGGAGLSCQMRLTAEQVFYLQELADR
ncbi:MAG: DUF1311 domain-containing protein [Rhodobacteraceae bacterium]|nr:DUF1311 domain-containing protein [Paracoccaceae bacterium]